MTAKQKAAIWSGGALSIAIVALGALFIIRQTRPIPPYTLTGVVLVDDSDPEKQTPIGYATVTASVNGVRATTRGDASGLFTLKLQHDHRSSKPTIRVHVQSAGYLARDLTITDTDQIQILRLVSVTVVRPRPVAHPVLISKNVRVRYAEQTTQTDIVGSVIKRFAVVNSGNLPCNGHPVCSPDGKWKASIGTAVLESQRGSFRNVRLSCIAGPCPFTKVESEAPIDHGHSLKVSVRNWSDTTIFLIEAEVIETRPMEIVREAFAAVLGSGMNFTVPAGAQGVSIEAEVGSHDIVYPLGPDMILSWAVCSVKTSPEGTRQFHCDLKPEYRFQ
jgi:hypothetical protein